MTTKTRVILAVLAFFTVPMLAAVGVSAVQDSLDPAGAEARRVASAERAEAKAAEAKAEAVEKERRRTLMLVSAKCRDAVQDRLRSPSSADFIGVPKAAWLEGAVVVMGEVDAQNGFGATVRSRFLCNWRNGGFTAVSVLDR